MNIHGGGGARPPRGSAGQREEEGAQPGGGWPQASAGTRVGDTAGGRVGPRLILRSFHKLHSVPSPPRPPLIHPTLTERCTPTVTADFLSYFFKKASGLHFPSPHPRPPEGTFLSP